MIRALLAWLRRVLFGRRQLENAIMAQLTDLTAQIHANTSAVESAKTLIAGLAAKLDAAKTDPAQLDALISELKSSDETLSAAVVANTPAQ